MNNPTLIIYDDNGKVWSVERGKTVVPTNLVEGMHGIIVDAPDGFVSISIDVDNATATFTLGEQEKIKAQIFYTAMMTDTLIEEV